MNAPSYGGGLYLNNLVLSSTSTLKYSSTEHSIVKFTKERTHHRARTLAVLDPIRTAVRVVVEDVVKLLHKAHLPCRLGLGEARGDVWVGEDLKEKKEKKRDEKEKKRESHV